jgi:predicted TIM-barrel fold metal-dependent hydrolase
MRRHHAAVLGLLWMLVSAVTGVIGRPIAAAAQTSPIVDHHQHFFSPAVVSQASGVPVIDADALIALLDRAGIRRAVVLSTAYQFANPNRPPLDDEYARVKAENDWTSAQAGKYPERLRGFCGLNPLRDYALEELGRCAKDPNLRTGLKLHFGNSDVDVENAAHVVKLREIFAAADRAGMAIVIHIRPSVTRERPWGGRQAQSFIDNVLPSAPHAVVQIAHLAGAGGYDDPAIDDALGAFVTAIQRGDPRMAHVLFDASGIVGLGEWKNKAPRIAERIRQLGIDRVLYGSDGAAGGNLAPREAWAAFRTLPLTEAELDAIAGNVAPYMK